MRRVAGRSIESKRGFPRSVDAESQRAFAGALRYRCGKTNLFTHARSGPFDDRCRPRPRIARRRTGTPRHRACTRSEEHTSELQSLMRISYAVFCLKKKKK